MYICIQVLRLFLAQLFSSVTSVLLAHSALVVTALLLADTRTREHEYAMLRLLGLRRRALALVLLAQAVYYALPGVFLGTALSYLASVPLVGAINRHAKLDAGDAGGAGGHSRGSEQRVLEPEACAVALLLGTLVPVAATLAPMRRALAQQLAEGLDVYHQAAAATSVHVRRLADVGVSASATAVASVTIVAGAVVFYVFPMAFLFDRLDLLFSGLNLVLMGAIVGLVLLSVLLQPHAERCLAGCLACGSDARFAPIVRKNLAAHYQSTRNAALIFCSSLAFLLFAGALFSLQAEAILANLKLALGSDLRVDRRTGALDEGALAAVLEADKALPAAERVVVDYAWASWPLWNIDPPVSRVWLHNLVVFPRTFPAETVAVSANFLDVTYGDFFAVDASDGCAGAACVRELDVAYDAAMRSRTHLSVDILSAFQRPSWCDVSPGACDDLADDQAAAAPEVEQAGDSIEALVGASLRPAIGAEVGTPLVLSLICQSSRVPSYQRVRRYVHVQVVPKAVVRKMPGYVFSSFEAVAALRNSVVVLGPQAFQRVLDLCAARVGINASALGLPTRPPLRTLHVRLSRGVTLSQRVRLQNRLASALPNDDTVVVTDTLLYVEVAAATVDMLMLFFYIVAALAAVLCFFMLYITFEATVRDNAWEFGVLRALGLNRRQLARIFIYESLCVITAAVGMGAAIGLVVAGILAMQQSIFTELPVALVLPGWLSLSLILGALAVAAVGAYVPVRAILQRPIAHSLRVS